MKIINIDVTDPTILSTPSSIDQRLMDRFFIPIYKELYKKLNPSTSVYPHIDYDKVKPYIVSVVNSLSISDVLDLRKIGCGKGTIEDKAWRDQAKNRPIMVFLWQFPCYANLLMNIHLLSDLTIKATEFYKNYTIDGSNFIQSKSFIDSINKIRWSRQETPEEKQSGVSNLGGISEMLLEKALKPLIDDDIFFRTTNQKIQSYGDFVLMCLPNNLWLSVKSNFARERLLASGYTTDIIGVGFFTSKDEFTSRSKIRNFQRVGFLAMYLPDVSISEEQIKNNKNTYSEVMDFYNDPKNNEKAPLNINGTNFIRPLSELSADLEKIIAIKIVGNRTTIDF